MTMKRENIVEGSRQDSQHRGDDTGIPVEQYRQALSDPEGIYGRERVTILYKRKLLLLKR
mgnify:CR=1 FL=1